MAQIYVKIKGITCDNCRNKITKELLKIKQIKDISIYKDIATINYIGQLNKTKIVTTINNLDYFTKEEYISSNKDDLTKQVTLYKDYQEVHINLSYNNYGDIIVQRGLKVKLVIDVDKKYLTGCNDTIQINEYNIKKRLVAGENIIEFTPDKVGDYSMNCWMNMIKNTIKVIDDKSYFKNKLKNIKGGKYEKNNFKN